MAVETADDRAFMLADFGVTVTNFSDYSTFTAIFDNAYEAVDAGGTVPMALVQPRILARTSDVAAVGNGTELVINDIHYVVRVTMPDGTGMTEMMLELQ